VLKKKNTPGLQKLQENRKENRPLMTAEGKTADAVSRGTESLSKVR